MCSNTKSDSQEEGNSTEIQRFLSKMIVIIIKRISLYSISILNKIFKLEGRKLMTSLKIAKLNLEQFMQFCSWKVQKTLEFSHCENAVLKSDVRSGHFWGSSVLKIFCKAKYMDFQCYPSFEQGGWGQLGQITS